MAAHQGKHRRLGRKEMTMSESNPTVARLTGGSRVPAAQSSEAAPAATGPTQAVSPRGRFFANPAFHFETLRNAGYVASNCADLGEILETVKVIAEGDVESWYAAWEATADRVLALAERTQDPLSKGGAYMRACTYQRMAEFLIPPDDPKRPESFEKTGSYFIKGLDTLGVRYERITVPYGAGSLRALYYRDREGLRRSHS